jgi:hypothetical protein
MIFDDQVLILSCSHLCVDAFRLRRKDKRAASPIPDVTVLSSPRVKKTEPSRRSPCGRPRATSAGGHMGDCASGRPVRCRACRQSARPVESSGSTGLPRLPRFPQGPSRGGETSVVADSEGGELGLSFSIYRANPPLFSDFEGEEHNGACRKDKFGVCGESGDQSGSRPVVGHGDVHEKGHKE